MTEGCPLCGSRPFMSIWHFKQRQSGCCKNCGHIYTIGGNVVDYNNFDQQYSDDDLLNPDNELFSLAKYRLRKIEEFMEIDGSRILEVGCGYGHFLKSLIEQGGDPWGIEASRPETVFARDKLQLKHIALAEYGKITGNVLTGGENAFDIVATFHALEHTTNPDEWVKLMKNDLRKNGLLAIAVPNLYTLHRDLHELYFIATGLHQHTFSPKILCELLVKHGLSIISCEDEPKSSMSPSSVLVIAKNDGYADSLSIEEQAISTCATMEQFHNDLDIIIANIKEQINLWRDSGEKIAIFGGGHHTRALIDLCELSDKDIACIIDDDVSKLGTSLNDINIVGFNSAEAVQCSKVIVSSLSSEKNIIYKLEAKASRFEVKGVYRDYACNIH